MKKAWYCTLPRHSGKSLDLVRISVAVILIAHPLHAWLHPENLRGFGDFLEARGLPLGFLLAWVVTSIQVAASLALLAGRFVVPACLGQILVLGVGIAMVHAPRWRTVGLPDDQHRPGAEFSVLLIACLCGVMLAKWPYPVDKTSRSSNDQAAYRGLEVIRLAASLILIIHPIGGLIEAFQNPTDLNNLGLYFSSIGYPHGVFLIWFAMFWQIACSIAIALRRFVVFASFGHIYVLCTGIWLFHAPHWFAIGPKNIIGPGEEGMEYSVLLITLFLSLAWAYWPRRGKQ